MAHETTIRLGFFVGVAAVAATEGWGVFNHWAVPLWLAVPLAVVAMDFVIWLQHVMVHAVPALWRLHRVHHADIDYDLTTGARFHPIEILLSMGIKFATFVLLCAPVLGVLVFEVLLSACAMFNHGDIRLPAGVDRVLRWFMVTPDMHRVHHSVEDDESNSNFGFNLTWWDRVFGTYQAEPRAVQLGMTIGIRSHTDPKEVARLSGVLTLWTKDIWHAARRIDLPVLWPVSDLWARSNLERGAPSSAGSNDPTMPPPGPSAAPSQQQHAQQSTQC